MPACCDHCSISKNKHAADCQSALAHPKAVRFTVALAGNPNSGKTTVFNALTGLRQKVANYPGVTVEKKVGLCRLPDGGWVEIIDLPGTYSLIPRSPDERVAMSVLRGLRAETPPPDVVVAVVDASNLQRNLYLVSQIIEMGRPLVVALNMVDVAERRGVAVDPDALSRRLGVSVVPVVGHKRRGIADLVRAISSARAAPIPDWMFPEPMGHEVLRLGHALHALDEGSEDGRGVLGLTAGAEPHERASRCRAVASRLLTGEESEDLARIAARIPLAGLVAPAQDRIRARGIDPMQAEIEAHYRWIEDVSAQCTVGSAVRELAEPDAFEDMVPDGTASEGMQPEAGVSWAGGFGTGQARTRNAGTGTSGARVFNGVFEAGASGLPQGRGARVHLSERVDAVLIHRVWGLLFFALIMGAMFASMFWLAKPIQGALGGLVGALGASLSALLPGDTLQSLVRDGIFAGVGSVVVFVPQIAILFLFLSLLEDSGYLARAAFLMDRLLAKAGLHGKSFIPLLSGFACAIPGIMATRTIDQRKGRLATILVLPFMTCSARLPIYGLLVATFFAGAGALGQAGIMLLLYAAGVLFATVAAYCFRRTLLKGHDSGFLLELPTYKVPQLSAVGRQVWSNSSKFLSRAGTTIFCICLVLWAISYYPRLPKVESARLPDANAQDGAQQAYSVAGRLGRAIEPGIRPLGFDWKIGVGCIGAFAAREVFVSTLAIIYGAGAHGGDPVALGTAMQADRYPDGRRVWTPLVAASLLLWFVLAMQCMSTVMVVRQETGGWRWPLFMLGYMNALAYVACLALYQIGSRLFGG